MSSAHLPVQLTPFVGRDEELSAIAGLLAGAACRLLTLIGPGGIGKTRLALEVAARHQHNYADGVYFVALQPLTDTHHLVPSIGQAVGFNPGLSSSPDEDLLSYLSDWEALLVLDNFEHLLDSAPYLSELLAAAPRITLLVTSRERLNLLEEWGFEVGGLTVPPDLDDPNATQPNGRYSAVDFFVQGAQRARRDFSPAPERASIERICRLVGGMPLALELASAWVRALPCADIADELARGFDILETSARNVTPRHQSMRNVLNYSWARLRDDERAVFRRLSVFRGGFTLDAAATVAGASRRSLVGLVDTSWLTYNADTGRYDVHELLRQYGEEQLDQWPDESTRIHDEHCQYYAEFLRRAWSRFSGAYYKEAKREVETELENVRSGWAWAVQNLNDAAIQLSLPGLWFFYDSGNRFQEGEQAFARLATALEDAGPTKQALRGKVLARQGAMCFSLDQFAKGMALLEESLALLEPAATGSEPEPEPEPDSAGVSEPPWSDLAFALLVMGMTMMAMNQSPSAARPRIERSIAISRRLDDRWAVAYGLQWLTHSYFEDFYRTGRHDLLAKANQLIEEAGTIFQQLSNQWGIALAQHGLGAVAYLSADYSESYRLSLESLRLFKEIDVHWGRVIALMGLCDAACALGNLAAARQSALQALEISTTFRYVKYAVQLLLSIADIDLHAAETEGAAETAAETAYELLAVARRELGKLSDYHFSAYPLLSRLDEALPPALQAAVERGQHRDLDAVIQEAINRLRRELDEEPVTPTSDTRQPATTPVIEPFGPPLREPMMEPMIEPLTERELDVLRLLAEGRSNREIAAELVLALGTVKTHVHNICGKLDAGSRVQAIARARALAII